MPRGGELHASEAAASTYDVLPAGGSGARGVRLAAPWLPGIVRRISELMMRPEGWDSYGAQPLNPDAIMPFARLVLEFGSVIQQPPRLSLTSEGGLLSEWGDDQVSLEFESYGDRPARVYYLDSASGQEWEGPASECVLLEKWMWQASGQAGLRS